MRLRFLLHQLQYAIVRVAPGITDCSWAQGQIAAVVRSVSETTVVCCESMVPPGLTMEGGLLCLEILDTSDLDSVGIVAAATSPLAEAGISLFAFSTWSADLFFIKKEDASKAVDALVLAGHDVAVENK